MESYTGPNGGFEIKSENLHYITMADIVRAIDGNDFFDGCALGLDQCDAKHPCPMHNSVEAIRNKMRVVLQNTTAYELAIGIKNKETLLKR
ncbi:hypothetical protein SDC9_188313 [bioreactor metagenome]|uniref:HTH-type transcriptional regulator IscR n=1 Tax=bioreactor metagenome TaxID=1076179 RepID=A0A645HX50_9ZZZZ